MRKAVHERLNVRDVKSFCPIQKEEAASLAEGLILHPEIKVFRHLHRVAASIGWRALWGFPTITIDGPDPTHRLDELGEDLLKASIPGGSLVDIFPPLRHIIRHSRYLMRKSNTWFEDMNRLSIHLYDTSCSSKARQEWGNSFGAALRDRERISGLSPQDEAWLTGQLFVASNDTTSTSLAYLVLAMVLYPSQFIKVRQQIDAVVGDSMPSFEDWEKLPLVEAVMKEGLRWRPPAPLGVPHVTSEDIRHGEYFLPKGTPLVANLWTISRDPALYTNAEEFDPSRFIHENGKLKQGTPDSHNDYLAFGFGRRVCAGKALAINSVWICLATLLWAFEFEPMKDADGNDILPNPMDFVDCGATVRPLAFPMKVIPRFPDLLQRIRASRDHSIN
ncbi:cytochrome P450 [Dacryopinax primogenitus]|uniref:Cytochrome P450 n=1 Tax=Dacryopinax primogenitus (strain DJM 731) TaxID=1858805 RepID=M5FY53_DACPD|nr:cytochrome P450 [Dacryopinax primogenitus]EJU00725.1 cytochrome P450 [Dacryopinax primogenitus]